MPIKNSTDEFLQKRAAPKRAPAQYVLFMQKKEIRMENRKPDSHNSLDASFLVGAVTVKSYIIYGQNLLCFGIKR